MPQGQGGGVGGSDGDADGGSGVGNVAVLDVLGNSRVVPLKEEIYIPPMTRSRTGASTSGFNEAHFYQYMDDHFSCLNLRLDAINEWQQQHA